MTIKVSDSAWAANLYQTLKWGQKQAQMEQICCRTGNYANDFY